jgi:hypothetical protein
VIVIGCVVVMVMMPVVMSVMVVAMGVHVLVSTDAMLVPTLCVVVIVIMIVDVGVIVIVRMIMIVMMAMIVPMHMRGLTCLPPEREAADERDKHQGDAAGQHKQVELCAEQPGQHRLGSLAGRHVADVQRQADRPECPGDADHADLVEEVCVAVVRVVVVVIVS